MDPFVWLEEVEGQKALEFVQQKNLSVEGLRKDPRYSQIKQEVSSILLSQDRIAMPSLKGGYVYNFWTDEKFPRGIWRRTSLEEYQKAQPQWETVLDVGALGAHEKESWVFKGADFLEPSEDRALVALSRGGKDAVEIREFDLRRKVFLADGFFIREAKTDVSWLDKDHILVSTDFGPGTLTESGYARILKLWKRGTPISQAKQIFEATSVDLSVSGFVINRPEGSWAFVFHAHNFYEFEIYLLKEDLQLLRIPVPKKFNFSGIFKGEFYFSLMENWQVDGTYYKEGTLLALSFDEFIKTGQRKYRLVYEPSERSSLQGIYFSRSKAWLEISKNVKTSVYELKESGLLERVNLPEMGEVNVASFSPFRDELFIQYAGFTDPASVYLLTSNSLKKVKSIPHQFDNSDLVTEQYESTSKDGTKIPYFVVRKKNMAFDSNNPTILYGYGGFMASGNPYYLATIGKTWLEKGGVYVLANIRGGGEFGPAWHRAGLRENRQKAGLFYQSRRGRGFYRIFDKGTILDSRSKRAMEG